MVEFSAFNQLKTLFLWSYKLGYSFLPVAEKSHHYLTIE